MYTHDTYEYKNFIIEIVTDDDPLNPREYYENLGTMICKYRDLVLGDDLPERLKERFKTWDIDEMAAFERWKNINQNYLVILPVYLFNHTIITISTKPFYCPWDSGQVGWIYASHNEIKRYFEVEELTPELIDKTRQNFIQEVKTYDDYLTGNVWGYLIKNKKNVVIDNCFGFWGYDGLEECQTQARQSADVHEKQLMPLLFL